jgi:hypothetical protein
MPDVAEKDPPELQELKRLADTLLRPFSVWLEPRPEVKDYDQARTVVNDIFDKLRQMLPDVSSFAPATWDAFLVEDGQPPGPGQLTVDGFAGEAVSGLAAAGVLPPGSEETAKRIVARALKLLGRRALDIETWIRWRGNLTGKLSDAARVLTGGEDPAKYFADLRIPYGDIVVAPGAPVLTDFPTPDDEKEYALRTVPPTNLMAWADKVAGRIWPEKSNREIGQAAHTYLQHAYCAAFPDHYVVIDGRVRATSIGPAGRPLMELHGLNTLDPMIAEKLTVFRQAMNNPGTKRQFRPDIADLHDAATGTNPADSWGWYEIKPWRSLPKAVTEVYGFYLDRWNSNPLVRSMPAWKGKPGAWWPPSLGVITTIEPKRIIVSATVPAGCIGYATFPLRLAEPLLATATVMVAWFSRFLSALLKRLDEFGRNGGLPDSVTAAVKALVCAVLFTCLIALLVVAAEAAAAWAAVGVAAVGAAAALAGT